MFIVFEGIDGSGKSTQIQLLRDKLVEAGRECLLTAEPSCNPLGVMARDFTKGKYGNMAAETIALLFAADRWQHYTSEIAPMLEGGGVVLCDRYYYSNMAYQGTDVAALARLADYNQAAMAARRPDFVFFLDVQPKECLRRINSARDEISIFETLPKLTVLRERFLTTFQHLGDAENIFVIDANGRGVNEIGDEIYGIIASKTKNHPL
ncbi:MAG: dTMP kinase [Defluviitaleaceae bacterium]|nr:dTMP kinase [Defluviitaleaceae bacterium]